MLKAELRKIYRAARETFSPDDRKRKSELIGAMFFKSFDLSEIRFLHCYLPIERFNEIDTRIIFQSVWRSCPHVQTLAPRVNFQTQEIENLKFDGATNLATNRWGVDEPARDEFIETEKIDLVLVPLLCFDARGYRVGYGKGFYDKFLKSCRADCLKIGLSFFPPVEKITDARDFDVRLDYCATPNEIFKLPETKLA